MKSIKLQGIRTKCENEAFVLEWRYQIARNALGLFAEKGLENTSVRDIARACNITPGNLYNYIGKKEDILVLVIQTNYKHVAHFIHEANEYVEVFSPVEALTKAIDQFFRVHDKNRKSTYFVNRDFSFLRPAMKLMVTESADNVVAVFEKIIKKGCVEGYFKVENTWLAAQSIRALGLIWSLQYIIYSKRYTIDEYIKLQSRQIFDMLNCNLKVKT
jgi:TetR/AcrR family transcriptional regulator, cholesterol catabolism regulator